MSQRSRLPSEVKTKAPLRVPTSNRTPLIFYSFAGLGSFFTSMTVSLELVPDGWRTQNYAQFSCVVGTRAVGIAILKASLPTSLFNCKLKYATVELCPAI